MMQRRDFIKTSSVIGGGLGLGLAASLRKPLRAMARPSRANDARQSRVVIAHRSDLRGAKQSLVQPQVARLLDTTIEALFQVPAAAAWRSLFSSRDVVGLKVNCLAGKHLSTHPEIVSEIVDRLLVAGVKKQNMIIFDRRSRDLIGAGFQPSQQRGAVQCLGNDQSGFTAQLFEYGAVASQISTILAHRCTAVINLPILKDHGIVGLSCAMKNFFGVINNPNKYHMHLGDPFIADVNMLPPIRDKVRLTICDALTAQCEGGPPFMPEWSWPMDSLLAAIDMVAMDRVAWDIIEQKRAENGIDSLEKAGRKPSYIARAADAEHQLGTDDLGRIEIVRV
ncbi:DUF362 domain-containing protein [candidate division KSB1 bacterium]|nr:DUF362 domain-containing protein [candidate division KSB1 bacterium]RQW02511.1 MAG: DUF362 domain-containing protein [candidate division KSB1 bacterium]